MWKIYLFALCIAILSAQSLSSPAQTSNIDSDAEEMKLFCNDKNDALSCIKYKALSFISNISKQDTIQLFDDVEIRKNGYSNFVSSGRAEKTTIDEIEKLIQSHDMAVNLPQFGARVVVSPKNLNNEELSININFADKANSPGDARKSKLKKVAIPIMVFVLLKAMTLIPLALGVLGLKAWNALQLSFFSFVISVALAIFQLCKKIATDNHHPQITHAPWEAARFFQEEEPKAESQNIAYNAYL